MKSGLSVKDAIAPTAFAFRTAAPSRWAAFLRRQLSEHHGIRHQRPAFEGLSGHGFLQIVTMHIQSVDQNRAIKTVKRTITELDRSKIEEQKKAIRAGYDIDIIPSDLATYGRDAKALLKELQSQNERMFLVTFLVLNTGRTEQELENNVFQASSIAQKHNCNLCRLDYQQEQGLMSSSAAGRLPDRDSAGTDHQQHCHLHSVHHTGTVPVRQRKPVLRPERPVQQPYHGGPEEAEEPEWPDFGYSRLRQKFLSKA